MLRDNLVELIEPMLNSAGADPLALYIHTRTPASDDRLPCLKNPRPEGAESSLTESASSPFQAEPAHRLAGHRHTFCSFRDQPCFQEDGLQSLRVGVVITDDQDSSLSDTRFGLANCFQSLCYRTHPNTPVIGFFRSRKNRPLQHFSRTQVLPFARFLPRFTPPIGPDSLFLGSPAEFRIPLASAWS